MRWGTIRGDMAGRDGERAERSTGNMLVWETGDEVMAVGRRIGNVGGGSTAPGSTFGTRKST